MSVAFSGPTVALSSTVSPSLRFAVVLSRVIVVAATFSGVGCGSGSGVGCGCGCGSGSGVGCGFSASATLISHVAVTFLPYAALAVIVTSPALTAVTVPSSATVAILSSDEDQITTLLVAFSGPTVAERLTFSPSLRLAVVLSRAIVVAGVFASST